MDIADDIKMANSAISDKLFKAVTNSIKDMKMKKMDAAKQNLGLLNSPGVLKTENEFMVRMGGFVYISQENRFHAGDYGIQYTALKKIKDTLQPMKLNELHKSASLEKTKEEVVRCSAKKQGPVGFRILCENGVLVYDPKTNKVKGEPLSDRDKMWLKTDLEDIARANGLKPRCNQRLQSQENFHEQFNKLYKGSKQLDKDSKHDRSLR